MISVPRMRKENIAESMRRSFEVWGRVEYRWLPERSRCHQRHCLSAPRWRLIGRGILEGPAKQSGLCPAYSVVVEHELLGGENPFQPVAMLKPITPAIIRTAAAALHPIKRREDSGIRRTFALLGAMTDKVLRAPIVPRRRFLRRSPCAHVHSLNFANGFRGSVRTLLRTIE
jgi:hypothetical protein